MTCCQIVLQRMQEEERRRVEQKPIPPLLHYHGDEFQTSISTTMQIRPAVGTTGSVQQTKVLGYTKTKAALRARSEQQQHIHLESKSDLCIWEHTSSTVYAAELQGINLA